MDSNQLHRELRFLLFAFIVDDFKDVKELYKDDPKRAMKLLDEKLERIKKSSQQSGKVVGKQIESI